MRYEILGPLRVIDHDTSLFVGPQKVETVLAALLIRAGHIVSADQLISEIWEGKAPRRANAGIHVYISQLRKFLHRAVRHGAPITTRPPGYMLTIGSDEFDLHSFQQFVDMGRAYAREGSHEETIDCLGSALTLWRGPVLDRVCRGAIVQSFVTWAEEARLECIETLIESRLALSRHRELVGELQALIAEHPLRETFYRQLMLALYRSQRQADALWVYRTARDILDDELGLEPCHALQDLQRAILTGEVPRQSVSIHEGAGN